MREKIKKNQTYRIDTDKIKDCRNRICDFVRILEAPKKYEKLVSVYSPKLRAKVLIPKYELREKCIIDKNIFKRAVEDHYKNWKSIGYDRKPTRKQIEEVMIVDYDHQKDFYK